MKFTTTRFEFRKSLMFTIPLLVAIGLSGCGGDRPEKSGRQVLPKSPVSKPATVKETDSVQAPTQELLESNNLQEATPQNRANNHSVAKRQDNQSPKPVALPRMVDLGAGTCVPCKMMAPILRDLHNEFKDKVQVDFIDVRVDPEQCRQYRILVIPTQIFFDAQGRELFRHEGFYSREEILAKWRKLKFIEN